MYICIICIYVCSNRADASRWRFITSFEFAKAQRGKCTYMYVCVYIYIHIRIYIHIYIYIYLYTQKLSVVSVYLCVCVCVCACMLVRVRAFGACLLYLLSEMERQTEKEMDGE